MIRILLIAPYQELADSFRSFAGEFDDVSIDIHVGDLNEALLYFNLSIKAKNYDVVISRGGTAKMLQKNLALPVIEIDISMYDILCALKLADGLTGKTAMVSFANITSSAHLLCDLMKYNMDIYTIDSAEAVEPTLRQLQKNDYGRYDLFIGMDSANIRNMLYIFGTDPDRKIHKLMDYTSRGGDVADPWYSRNFEVTYKDVLDGCTALLDELIDKNK